MNKLMEIICCLGRVVAVCPELWILGFISMFLFSCVLRVEPWWTVYLRLKCLIVAVYGILAKQHIKCNEESKLTEPGRESESEEKGCCWNMHKANAAVFAIQGRRPKMEDRFSILIENEHTDTTICGLFDGHGGEFAADFVEKTLFKSIMVRILKSALGGVEEDFTEILKESILNLDKQLLSIAKISSGPTGGTTCLVSLIHKQYLYVANVGDSRSIICDENGEAVALTEDHKPQQLNERRRIKEAGGFIAFHGVWRVGGVLATSRALGDLVLKQKNLIVADPDVERFDLEKLRPKFMIMATDGLWDSISNQDAVDFVKDKLHEPLYGAKSLVSYVFKQGAIDNITVLIINFESLNLAYATSSDTNASENRIKEEHKEKTISSAKAGTPTSTKARKR